MSFSNSIIVGGAFGFLLLMWVIVGVRHLRMMRVEISRQLEKIDVVLRGRRDLVPNLIETLWRYDRSRNELISRLIDVRGKAAKAAIFVEKTGYERDLRAGIEKLTCLGAAVAGLGKDTNFLELKREIEEMENEIVTRTGVYNKNVQRFNFHRRLFFLWPLAVVMRYGKMDLQYF